MKESATNIDEIKHYLMEENIVTPRAEGDRVMETRENISHETPNVALGKDSNNNDGYDERRNSTFTCFGNNARSGE